MLETVFWNGPVGAKKVVTCECKLSRSDLISLRVPSLSIRSAISFNTSPILFAVGRLNLRRMLPKNLQSFLMRSAEVEEDRME